MAAEWVTTRVPGVPGTVSVLFDEGRVYGFRADGEGAEITATHLRAIPLARLASLAGGIDGSAVLVAPSHGLTDGFLRQVAAAYLAALSRRERPNVALAAQAGVALATVRRWVYLSRKKGFLPKTRRGAS